MKHKNITPEVNIKHNINWIPINLITFNNKLVT